jgi:predicted metalloprotease
MENCYGYEDMQAYLDQIIPMVEQFFDAAYTDMPHPKEYIYVSEGDTGSTGCTDGYTDQIYAYCPADETIYTGQRALWGYYSDLGDAAPAVGLAHEWGHHVQVVASVPPAQTPVGQISRENQADCIAGAWIAYADEQGWLNYPDDLRDIDGLLAEIASDEPGRSHGDVGERSDSMKLGIGDGLQGCNDFFPDSPVITSSSALPNSTTATASPSASPSP